VTPPAIETSAELRARIDAAMRARTRLATRPLGETAAALAAAATAWRANAELISALPAVARLDPTMVAATLPLVAEALDADAMAALVESELGTGAITRPAPTEVALVAHVLASNVPALALPAIALACLAGAAVVVKSGRDDPLSAPAFRHALAAVDPDLAATVVTVYWPGGASELEEVLFGRADVAVLTGGEPALAALAGRVGGRVVTHGPRVSVAAVGRDGLEEAERVAHAVALDVALYEQRGCLSPRAVYVESDGRLAPRDFAERLAAALAGITERLPPMSTAVEERAATRVLREGSEWTPGTTVLSGPGGTVVYDEDPSFRPTLPARSVRVHPIASLAALPALLPAGHIECLGLAARDPCDLVPALRERGVSRLCPVGRMQRPPLAWPRGQHAPLAALLGHSGALRCTVET